MDEQEFLARVRKAVARPVPHFGDLLHDHVQQVQQHNASAGLHEPPAPAPLVETPQFLGEMLGLPDPADQHGLTTHWVQEFQKLGGHPVVAADGAAAVAALVTKVQEILARRGGSCAITAHPLFEQWRLADSLRAAGIPVQVYHGSPERDALAEASVGIAVASQAVAETGSFVIESHTHQGRLSSLLPPVFIGVVPPGALSPGVAGWLSTRGARFRAGEEMPSSTVFATGPSRSADIAGELALGVHGPGEVHAVVVRGA